MYSHFISFIPSNSLKKFKKIKTKNAPINPENCPDTDAVALLTHSDLNQQPGDTQASLLLLCQLNLSS